MIFTVFFCCIATHVPQSPNGLTELFSEASHTVHVKLYRPVKWSILFPLISMLCEFCFRCSISFREASFSTLVELLSEPAAGAQLVVYVSQTDNVHLVISNVLWLLGAMPLLQLFNMCMTLLDPG